MNDTHRFPKLAAACLLFADFAKVLARRLCLNDVALLIVITDPSAPCDHIYYPREAQVLFHRILHSFDIAFASGHKCHNPTSIVSILLTVIL